MTHKPTTTAVIKLPQVRLHLLPSKDETMLTGHFKSFDHTKPCIKSWVLVFIVFKSWALWRMGKMYRHLPKGTRVRREEREGEMVGRKERDL